MKTHPLDVPVNEPR